MSTKLLALRRSGTCSHCGSELAVGTEAWWDSVARKAECANCRGFLASAKGADGRRKLSAHLHSELGQRAVVLDDRRAPGTRVTIDHVVVASSGVWVVDAKDYNGRVERRDVGGWFKVDERLYVAGRDRTNLVDGLDRQMNAVERMLEKEGLDRVPVHAALCFVNSEWGWFAKPFNLNGVWVTWAQKLTELVLEWNAVPVSEFDRLARIVAARLPASS